MNRRIVLVDQIETPDFAKFYGCGLGSDIYTVQQLQSIEGDSLKLGPGDGILLAGAEPFKYLQNYYHFGIRNENYFDCSKLRRLSIEGGAFAKVLPEKEFPGEKVINDFMSEDFTKPKDFSWFQHKTISTYQEAMNFLAWLELQPEGTNYGFDYEASGMATDKWFDWSGVSLCTINYGGFISFTDLKHNGITEEEYSFLKLRLGKFLESRMDYLWAFNMQYEYQVSHRMLGVDLYNLRDAGVFNILDGNHLKKYSLKWTANMVLETEVWDAEFDWISETIDSMLFETVGKLKRDKRKVLRVTPDNFKDTDEWNALCQRYPEYVNEFEQLILEYWGNPFMCIPSKILGHYCNLDAFYTLMIYEVKKHEYKQEAIDTFCDNIRLAARLHSCGIPKWEEYRLGYGKYCQQQMAWGITYCASARCQIKMRKHAKLMANIKKYNPICRKLLEMGKFYNGVALDIVKNLLVENIDTIDAYDTGINEGALVMKFGPDFASEFIDKLKETMAEIKFKDKIDASVIRKKKLLGIMAEKITPILGLDKLKLGNKHVELEKYIYYETAYKELVKVSKNQLNDIMNIPDKIYIFGRYYDLLEYSDMISENYFKCKSPIENDEIALEFAELYKAQSAYLAAMFDSTQQLNNADKFYSSQGIESIEHGFNNFMTEWEDWCKQEGKIQYTYPDKVFNLALQYWRDLGSTQVKEIWTTTNGYTCQSQFFPTYDKEFVEYGLPFEEKDLDNDFFFMRKLNLNYLIYKKYAKVLSTYIDGMFLQSDKCVIENPVSHVVIREADPDEPGAITKMFPRFQCMEKSSKRWSSGYHTIVSHSDIKSTIRSYPGHLLSYFDISSAEVKSAGFASQDPDLIDKFIKGEDIYIYSAKLYLPNFEQLSDKEKKMWRKRFKTIFLGVLYGLGKKSLAERLNCSEEEAEDIIQGLYKSFPKLREYVASQQDYPMNHDGYINTFLGDKLKIDEWKYYEKATNSRERKNLEARIKRLGVNLPIQGGTSSVMASGFFNDLREATKEDWSLTSFITVHDSNTCDFPAHKVWDIRKHYDKNFTDFCYNTCGIKLLFDLEVGNTYQDSCSMKQIDDDTVEFKGNARSILMIIEKMNEDPLCKYEINIPIEDIKPNYIQHPLDRFIREKGCSYVMDTSKYSVQFKRIKS